MSLASVLQTALSGMSAASFVLRVTSNNLANSQTAGFKAGRPVFMSQPSSTQSVGGAPSASSGGSNPVQIGAGVKVAGVATDFSQGAIVASSNPLDLALEGDGVFIVEGPSGERSYTRAGELQLNANGELVTSAGDRVLGFGVDEQFQVEGGELQPLSIPIGSTTTSANGEAATLTSFSISDDGRIIGQYSDGVDRDLGQIRIARFANPSGLEASGDNGFQTGANSGLPIESNPGTGASASIVAGATELSNTDVGQSIVDLVLASQNFRANATVFGTASDLLDELTSLRRSDG
ncbi:MAG: flagellar hook basal-body protein [Pirellulales bacterium]